VPGVAGFLWLWVWQTYYHSPASHPGLTEQERQLIRTRNADQRSGHRPPPWYGFIYCLRHREVWGLILSRFFHDGAFYFYVYWLPLYLYQDRGFDIKQIAIFAWIPFLASDIGSVAGGWLGKRLIQGGMSLGRSRKLMIWSSSLLTALTLPAVSVDSAYLAIALIAIAMFAIQAKAANLFALPADLFPSREVATIWGLFGAVGSLGGAVFGAWVGWVTESTGYGPVFLAVVISQILSAVVISVLVPRVELLEK